MGYRYGMLWKRQLERYVTCNFLMAVQRFFLGLQGTMHLHDADFPAELKSCTFRTTEATIISPIGGSFLASWQ